MQRGRIGWIGLLILLLTFIGCDGRIPGQPTDPMSVDASSVLVWSTDARMTEASTSTIPSEEPVTVTETVSGSSAPSYNATEAAEPSLKMEVEELLAQMTLEDRVAQLFVVTPEALTGATRYETAESAALLEAFHELPVGGFLLMGGNLKNPEQVRSFLTALQRMSRERLELPLFLCVDEEGGTVSRVSGKAGFDLPEIPSMAQVGASGDLDQARELGTVIGSGLQALGFNVDLAPVADVLTNPENRVVRERSFGDDADLVIAMADAFSEGLLEAGVLPCWKHFPGHGGTVEDSHKGAAVISMDWDTLLDSRELRPFLAAADQGQPMIMVGHIAVPEATGDNLPASLSEKLIGILRPRYDGLLITDALNMKAVADRFSPGEAAVMAIQAGNDLLLYGEGSVKEAYRAVLDALADGRLTEERINESIRRILTAKQGLSG